MREKLIELTGSRFRSCIDAGRRCFCLGGKFKKELGFREVLNLRSSELGLCEFLEKSCKVKNQVSYRSDSLRYVARSLAALEHFWAGVGPVPAGSPNLDFGWVYSLAPAVH